ncbi:Glyoxalase/Bleomycin resistance protein/Dioxygenase superfamily protein [Halogranum rubrum]|uniref:Glyoxalase/Bleomycin resistance protein/Dioxygenase superfamily protein n=1 Tax=Halogranum rubrum TaxID=553466 RepID=A0A1I4F9T2_9EURY|nr:VOC family protein [Halogranum rubrum]SFL13566.1 Glyoxalase/Bleomycin resistance protein/Dioxygenase superfamily protein [Halogranum rubrum]
MAAVPDLGIEIPEITQIAFVVEDIEDGMNRFDGLLGIGPWDVFEFEPPTLHDTTFRGESHDYSMTLALSYLGETMIELIEPKAGESLYTEHLDEHGEGLHHVACFAFEDTEGVVETFEENGIPVIQSGVFGETPYWYFDTAEQLNGVIFETATNLEAIPEPDRQYP